MRDTVNIGLLGFGTVGGAVYELIAKNASVLTPKVPRPLAVRRVCVKDMNKKRAVDASLLTDDWKGVVTDPGIDVVVEVMGDYPEALAAMRLALESGKPVVTANKAALARHGVELFEAAQKNGVKILYEASVAGGIPILRALREGLSANRIESLRGIINGTCNYILTEMEDKKLSFDDALRQAQSLGYAEADPASDVDGVDAAYKLCILIMLCYGVWIPVQDIPTEGVTGIAPVDFEMARQFGYAVKLMGITRFGEGGIEARVHPVMIGRDNPIAHVGGAFNAIQYHADYAGTGMLYGRGAGGSPTASSVVSDIIEACQGLGNAHSGHASPAGYAVRMLKAVKPLAMGELVCPYYLRFSVIDKPNVLAQIAAILGRHEISIQNVYQHASAEERRETPLIAFTHRAKEWDVQKALAEIDKLDCVIRPTQIIRIEED